MARQRWTDEMLDNLANSVASHDRQFEALRDTVLAHDRQNEERNQRTTDLEEQMAIMAIGINRLIEDSREYKQWKVENDLRFNILLEEIRAVTRHVEVLED